MYLGCRHPFHSPQSTVSIPKMVVYTSVGGGDVQVFTFTVLPAHPTQMPVLANNMAVQDGEECTAPARMD